MYFMWWSKPRQIEAAKFAQASRRRLEGSNYRGDLVTAEIQAEGHGDQNSQDAGRIAVVESWAEYIGMSYTSRMYGLNNSLNNTMDAWQVLLEMTHNENQNHIPIGIHHDLVDITPGEGDAWDEDDDDFGDPNNGTPFPVDDQVDGFTNQQIFQSLNASVTNPDEFRVWLNNNFTAATGNAPGDVNDLFNSY